jgi:hypothetical protein
MGLPSLVVRAGMGGGSARRVALPHAPDDGRGCVFIRGHGVVATGQATAGSLRVFDAVLINGLIHAKVKVGTC